MNIQTLNQNTKAVVEENLIKAFCKMPAILSKLPVIGIVVCNICLAHNGVMAEWWIYSDGFTNDRWHGEIGIDHLAG